MTNVAVILAGGIGSRVGGATPKQLLPLEDGRTILEHSIDAFEASPCIDEIAVVMHPDWMDEMMQMERRNSWRKVQRIIPGGAERWESSYHAVKAYSTDKTSSGEISLLLHDAARPFVSQRIISDVCQALETREAVTVAVPSTDTVYITKNNRLSAIPSRETVWRAQTPQAFRLDLIAEAFRRALEKGQIAATDDVGIVHTYMPDTPVFIVPGEETNRKITFTQDLQR